VTKQLTASPLFVPKEPQLRWGELPLPFSSKSIPRPVQSGDVFHFQQARYALFHGIRLLGFRPGDKILVPAFHCSTLIEGVLRTGVDVVFYNVKPNLIIDLEDLERKVDDQTKGLLMVHFFGVLQPMEPIQAFCKDKSLRLIEDCAHILRGKYNDKELGTLGDISIFSWRKFFPIPNGGTLVVPRKLQEGDIGLQKCSLLQNVKDFRWGLGQCIDSWGRQLPRFLGGSFLQETQLDSVVGLRRSEPAGDFDEEMISLEESWFSLNYLKNCQLENVNNIRNQHWKFMASALGDNFIFLHSWGNIWQNAVAWAFPLLMTGYENFHVELRKRGIPAFGWGGVIHQRLNLKEFPDAELLYSSLVLLPIHQDISLPALEYVAETVNSLVKKR